jgi:hypothetical protein
VDDESCTASTENGMGIIAESDVRGDDHGFGATFEAYSKAWHVTGVRAFGILQAVMLSIRIEMAASGFEVGAFALGGLMDVDGVRAWRKILHVEFDHYAVRSLGKSGGANTLALGVT